MKIVDKLHLVSSPSLREERLQDIHLETAARGTRQQHEFQENQHSDLHSHANDAETLQDGVPEQFAARRGQIGSVASYKICEGN